MDNIVNVFLEFYNKINLYSVLGTKETKYAHLIGKAPHIGSEAWLHSIYNPITDKEVCELNTSLIIKLPKVYEKFLKVCNGFSIFGTTLSFYGFRYNNIRDLENIWQPFDIVNANNKEKPKDALSNHFFIGSYSWDGSKIYIDTDTLKVYRCSRESINPLKEWENFDDLLLSEINRIMELFNEKGQKIDKSNPTIPS